MTDTPIDATAEARPAPGEGRRGTTLPPATLDRIRVLAHRAHVQHLVEPAARPAAVDVLGLGVQNTPRGAAVQALRARTSAAPARLHDALHDGSLRLVMLVRGAPHVVRTDELPLLAAATRPPREDEADGVDEIAEAMREVTTTRDAISKPELSERLNSRVSESLRDWCPRCGSRHVDDVLFRKASLPAGLAVDPDSNSPVRFLAIGQPPAELPDALTTLVRRFVELLGPIRREHVAAWLGHKPGELTRAWEALADELVPVEIDGRRSWAHASSLDALSSARVPDVVRLLPPSDPFLLGDRSLLLPDRAHQRAVWRAVSSPGVVLSRGQLVGTWRQRIRGSGLQITVSPFEGLSSRVRDGLDTEATAVAAVRGLHDARLTIDP